MSERGDEPVVFNDLIRDLRCCNLGIDVWQSSRAYVSGFREVQLGYFYGQREVTLKKLKLYKVG